MVAPPGGSFADDSDEETLAPIREVGVPPYAPLLELETRRESAPLMLRGPSPLTDPAERARRIEAHAPRAVVGGATPATTEALEVRRDAQRDSAALLEAAGDVEGARDAYARAIGLGDDGANMWRGLARTRARTGDLEGAEAALLAALDRDGGSADLYFELAELCLALGRIGDAVLALERAADLAPASMRIAALRDEALLSREPAGPKEAPAAPVIWPSPPIMPLEERLKMPVRRAYSALPNGVRGIVDDVAAELSTTRGQRIAAAMVFAALLLLILPRWLRQRGDLAISLLYPVELRGTFRVRLATKKNQWKEKELEVTRGEIVKGGTSSRNEHHLVSRETHFRRIPARRYFVVVDGMLQNPDGGEILADARERKVVRVRHRRTVRLEFDLHPPDCPVDVEVLWDGQRPRDAAVTTAALAGTLFDAHAEPVRLHLRKGLHTLVVGSGDRVVERSISVDTHQPKSVLVDIADAEDVIFKGCPPAVEAYLHGDLNEVARALERDGQVEQAHLLLARMAEAQGEIQQAAEHYEQAGLILEAAELRVQLENYSEAGALFDAANDPQRAAEMFRAAGELVRAGESFEAARNFDDALACYREAGEMSKCVDALDRRGDTFAAAQIALDNGWRARAIRLLRLVGPDDPHFSDACALLADAFEREGHVDLAAQKLEEHIAVAGPGASPPDLFFRLAELVEQTGNVDRALSLLEELRSREPTFPNVATRIELLRKKRSATQSLAEPKISSGADFAPTMFLSDHRYEVVEELGRGGMGVVFRARDRRLSRIVALKRLPESLRNYPRAVQLFLREAQATARLNHPNIVTVYDADQEDGQFFITMELLEGKPLQELLRERGRLEVDEVLRIGIQVAEGLHYAHQQKVVHRDIKTANLFQTSEETIKIMDFGLAKTLEEVRRAETGIGGTPFYMAPEQVIGNDVDHRADLYAFGATLFELSTGTVPFSEGDVTYHHRHTPAPDPRERAADLPDELAELVLSLLEKNAEDRPQSASDVRERLEDLLGVQAV